MCLNVELKLTLVAEQKCSTYSMTTCLKQSINQHKQQFLVLYQSTLMKVIEVNLYLQNGHVSSLLISLDVKVKVFVFNSEMFVLRSGQSFLGIT